MSREAILWPMTALVGLTFLVWCVMYWRRIGEIRRAGISPQLLATRKFASAHLRKSAAADNFSNLLEAPVLFYVLCLVLVITDQATSAQVALAWVYVLLRSLHSLIHVTYNRVIHRFAAHVLSMACLSSMWAVFAISLAS